MKVNVIEEKNGTYAVQSQMSECVLFNLFIVLVVRQHTKTDVFQRPPTPMEKPRYTYCRVFFVDSIYSTTTDIMRKEIFFFYF